MIGGVCGTDPTVKVAPLVGAPRERRDAPDRIEPSNGSDLSQIVTALRDHDMPADEIWAVVGTDDPIVVHRYFELHRERLQERLAERTLALAGLERQLVDAARGPAEATRGGDVS